MIEEKKNWIELKNKILGKMIVEGWAEQSAYEIEPYLFIELVYKLGFEEGSKEVLTRYKEAFEKAGLDFTGIPLSTKE